MTLLMMVSLTLAVWMSRPVAGLTYDDLCDVIVNKAKQAAAAFNHGDSTQVANMVGEVESAFEAAKAKDAVHPQAYFNMGVFYSNANRFEDALPLLDKALGLLPRSTGDSSKARAPIEMAIRRAKYGRWSMLRDKAYANGLGNLTLAREYALQQLAVTPQPHITAHEVATLELMLCEYDAALCKSAATRFVQAQTSSSQHYARLKASHLGQQQAHVMKCIRGPTYVGRWGQLPPPSVIPKHPNVTETAVNGISGLYGFEVSAPWAVLGRDGLVTMRDPSDCAVFTPASDPLINAAAALLTDVTAKLALEAKDEWPAVLAAMGAAAWSEPPPAAPPAVLSLVQFAASSFYHWLCEAIPRLVVAAQLWKSPSPPAADGTFSFDFDILVPKTSASSKFIGESLQLLGVGQHGRGRAIELADGYYAPPLPTTATSPAFAGLRFVSWDRQSVTLDNGDVTGGYSLAHPEALRRARSALQRAIDATPFGARASATGRLLLAARGDTTKMRHLDEKALVAALEAAFPQLSPVVIADGTAPLAENLALYRSAKVVVGAHGGALSNIIACNQTTSVVEIGFHTPAARHYEHVARALGLPYQRVQVDRDALERALGAPTISVSLELVVAAVRRSIAKATPARGGDEL